MPLAIAPLPAPGEHVAGYVRRLALVNSLSSLRLLGTMYDVGPMSPFSGDAVWSALGQATGLPQDLLAPMRWRNVGKKLHRWVDVSGKQYRLNDLDFRHMRHCPDCLAKDGILHQDWSVRLVTACIVHRTRLVDACGACGRGLLLDERTGLFACSGCSASLMDHRAQPASAGAVAITAACIGAAPKLRPPTSFHDIFNLSPGRATAVIDRLATLGRLRHCPDGDDEPDDRTPPRIAAAEARVKGALALLDRWPDAYLELLSGMADAHGARCEGRAPTALARLTTRPVLDETGAPIPFLLDPTQRFQEDALGLGARRRAPGRRPRHSQGTWASGPAAPSGFQPISHAAAMGILEGRENEKLAIWWIRAGLLTEHHRSRRALLSMDEVTELNLRLDADRGTSSTDHVRLPHVDLTITKGREYAKDLFLRDVFAGRIACLRVDDGSGLGGLAFSRSDLDFARAEARLTAWQAEDAYVALSKFNEAAVPIFGPAAALPISHWNALARRGEVRFNYYLPPTQNARRQKRWAVRDLIGHCGSRRTSRRQ